MNAPVHFDLDALEKKLLALIDDVSESATAIGPSGYHDAQVELMRMIVPVRVWLLRHGVNGTLGPHNVNDILGKQLGSMVREETDFLGHLNCFMRAFEQGLNFQDAAVSKTLQVSVLVGGNA